jgi:hypothetical protein
VLVWRNDLFDRQVFPSKSVKVDPEALLTNGEQIHARHGRDSDVAGEIDGRNGLASLIAGHVKRFQRGGGGMETQLSDEPCALSTRDQMLFFDVSLCSLPCLPVKFLPQTESEVVRLV